MRFTYEGCSNRACSEFNPARTVEITAAEVTEGVVLRPTPLCASCGCELPRKVSSWAPTPW